jgi:8-oxo-dGTP pyrophosphatase MutT (NUDIX family)
MTVLEQLLRHTPADPEEEADRQRMIAFVRAHEQPFDRSIAAGHLTGSALVVSSTGAAVLLLHHHKLARWLQPGGHADPGEATGEQVALREALEETGIEGLTLHTRAPRPLDVDVHHIPARPGEAEHEHLDLRYLVVAPANAVVAPAAGESERIRWFRWDELDGLGLDTGLVRALGKVRQLC